MTMSHEYEEARDRALAVPAGEEPVEFVYSQLPAIHANATKREVGKCERPECKLRHKFWVQRGPIGIRVCGPHLSTAISEMHSIPPGRYHVNEEAGYNGYWISVNHTVIVKMQVGDNGGWR